VLKELASLPRAIGIMAVITALSALGTIIPQNKVNSMVSVAAAAASAAVGAGLLLAKKYAVSI
jgi:cytochrome c biogenesis protein ResB